MAHAHGSHHHLHHIPVEPVAGIVLAAAGVLTSWAGYQASLWDGVQLAHYGRAASHRVVATQAALDASLTRAVEVSLFRAWVEAKFNGEERMARYYEERFPAELRESFVAWKAMHPQDDPKAPPSPFAMKSYKPQGLIASTEIEDRADQEFQSAIRTKHTADEYLRAGVVLATAMFFAGIGQIFKRPLARALLAGVAVLALLVGVVQMATLPIMTLGQLH